MRAHRPALAGLDNKLVEMQPLQLGMARERYGLALRCVMSSVLRACETLLRSSRLYAIDRVETGLLVAS